MPRDTWRPQIDYGWAPEGVRPSDMARFMKWAYEQWAWAVGDFIWMAKFKPTILRGKYDYWRYKYAA